MKHLLIVAALLLAISCGETKNEKAIETIDVVVEKSPKLEKLTWLLGDWININSETQSYEHWERESATSFVAYSLTLRGKDTVLHEQMRMYDESNVLQLYVETVGDNPNPVVFTQKDNAQHPFTFENPRNEFPSQIVYTLPEANKIHAWVAGFIDGVPQKQDFYFKRVIEE